MKTFITILTFVCLSSCCCQEQGVPALRPMPNCEQQPTMVIPVKVGK